MIKTLLLVALLAFSVCALKGITELNDRNFKQTLGKDNSLWLVLFAAEWVRMRNYIVWTLQTSQA